MKPNPDSRLGVTLPQFILTHTVPTSLITKSEGEWVRGKWVEGSETVTTINANIQPLKGSELQVLPESIRTRESIKAYTVSKVKTAEEVDETTADIIVWEGKRFTVMRSIPYKMGVLNHYKVICCRLPETPNELSKYAVPVPTPQP